MKKKKLKKMAKEIRQRMQGGEASFELALFFDLTEEEFNKLIEDNEILKKAHTKGILAYRKYWKYYLQDLMNDSYSNKDAIRLFYSHYLDVHEKKDATQSNESYSIIMSELEKRLPN